MGEGVFGWGLSAVCVRVCVYVQYVLFRTGETL